ncbi:MAG TPA: ABC transporter substrate-binding protein [Nevskiaceae bacterium]
MKGIFRVAAIAAGAAVLGATVPSQAAEPVKVGLMLPYSGTYAKLGDMIEKGFRLYVDEHGGKLAGDEITYVKLDDESDPAKATDNANKLIKRDHVNVLVGTVHSGVAMAMARVAEETGTLMIDPNAGAMAITGPMCSLDVVRSSFNNWQPGYGMGVVAAEKGWKKAMTITWNYAAGKESVQGFTDAFTKGGGKVIKNLTLPFPNVQFEALLTEIAAQKPDVVYTFFAGGGAVKFVKDYAAAGLKDKIPLVGAGFVTDGTLEAQGAAAEGLLTSLHYADDLDVPKNHEFRKAFVAAYKVEPDVYAVQGYDAAQLLAAGLKAVNGDMQQKATMEKAIRAAIVDSPRGTFRISPSGDPIQNMYLRRVRNGHNDYVSVAVKDLVAPSVGCKLK